jgi:xanthine dehydrogenase YagR molybdenum-binding subunit
MACVELARQAGVPVKMILGRHEDFLATGNRPSAYNRIKLAADKEGNLTAFESNSYGTGGYSSGGWFPTPYIYEDIPNQRRRHRNVSVNAGNARPMRAPGHPQGCYSMEQAMDMLANKLGMDPLELRKKNDPNEIRRNQYDVGADMIGWSRRRTKPGSDPGPLKRGLGVAGATWWGGGGKNNKAHVKIHPDGSVEVFEASQCIGNGTRTFIAQIAAEELGLPMEAITVNIGNSDYPQGNTSAGSSTAPSTAPVIKNGADMARAKLFEKVAPRLDVSPDDLVAADGRVFVKHLPGNGLDWNDACKLIGNQPIEVLGEWGPGLNTGGSNSVQLAEVEVDVRTGKIRIIKMAAVHECGLVMNRLATESQITGGIVMSIGYALSECRRIDSQEGRVVNPNMIDYKVAGALEIPEILVELQDYPERGVIGIGEPPTIPTAAAIANAVANATGARIHELPMTPDVVLKALGQV